MRWFDEMRAKSTISISTSFRFEGVYICTKNEEQLGHILDVRDFETAPSFHNLIRKSTEVFLFF